MKDILTEQNTFKDLDIINNEFKVKWNFLDYLKLRQSIPRKWKLILNNTTKEDKSTNILYNKLRRYKTLKSVDCYWLLLPTKHDLTTVPNSFNYWINKYDISYETLTNHLTIPYECIRDTRTQALQFKIQHKIFNSNHWLHKLKILNSPNCTFCGQDDTIEHFFHSCNKTNEFWLYTKNWWNRLELFKIDNLKEKDIILGVVNESEAGNILNCIILIAKASIYNNKMNNKEPDLYTFFCQLKFFLTMEEQIYTKNESHDKFCNKWSIIYDNL
jgi:hypothetical protein